ncbi:MAG: alpha/beta hydrolase [Rhodospirillaceae bacterium]|nr:alpha/beta hydrolase [Rhodospirillaceae bacterium]
MKFSTLLWIARWSLVIAGVGLSATAVLAENTEPSFEPRFIDVNGIRTRYYDIGKGEVIVLVHGSGFRGSASADLWAPVFPYLSKNFRVVAADKLAAGGTDNPKDDKDLNIHGEIRHTFEFIQAMKLDKIHLVGQSRGAGLALFLAHQNPSLVKTLTLVNSNTAAPVYGYDDLRRARALAACGKAGSFEYYICTIRTFSYTPDNVTPNFVAITKALDETQKSVDSKRRKAALGSDEVEFSEWKAGVLEQIRQRGLLKMPILLYWGQNDPTAVLEQGISLFDVLGINNPNVRLMVINQAGHFPFREYPAEFSHDLESFIKKQQTAQ